MKEEKLTQGGGVNAVSLQQNLLKGKKRHLSCICTNLTDLAK